MTHAFCPTSECDAIYTPDISLLFFLAGGPLQLCLPYACAVLHHSHPQPLITPALVTMLIIKFGMLHPHCAVCEYAHQQVDHKTENPQAWCTEHPGDPPSLDMPAPANDHE